LQKTYIERGLHFSLSVKAVKSLIGIVSIIFVQHKIALLMQCVESIINALFPYVFLIIDGITKVFLIEAILWLKYARITPLFTIKKPLNFIASSK
jgi:hypothetical protein